MSNQPVQRYSAIASIELLVNGRAIRVAQVAPDYVIVDAPMVLPAGPATLVINIEGEITRREVELPHGASGDSCFIKIRRDH